MSEEINNLQLDSDTIELITHEELISKKIYLTLLKYDVFSTIGLLCITIFGYFFFSIMNF